MQESIDEHLATRSKGDVPRDFLDVYLDEIDNQDDQQSGTYFTSNFNIQ